MNVQEARLQEQIDPHLSDRVLSQLAEQATGTTAGVRGYTVLTGGCWNRVIAVEAGGRELVYKISPHTDDRKIIREFAVLGAFRDQTDLTVPEPLLLSTDGPVPGTLLAMTRIPGAVMHQVYGLLNYGQRRAITDQIAVDLAELHRNHGSGFGGVEVPPDKRAESWGDFWLPRFHQVLDEAGESGVVPSALLDGARAAALLFDEPLAIGRESTLTHYDIWSGNVMIDLAAGDPRVSGYIDIPGYYADYARELSFAMLFGVANRRFFEHYTREHELDEGFELRANIYNLKMNIKHIQMYPSQGVYQQGAAENLRFIQEHCR